MRAVPRSLALCLVGVLLSLSACAHENDADPDPPQPSDTTTTATAPTVQVLFDRPWVVVEGVWFISTRGYPRYEAGSTTGLLNATAPGSVYVNGPALYGKYAVRVEAHSARPSVPQRCEDVVEVSLTIKRSLSMGSFETFTRRWRLTAGDYRLRYCATGLDRAAAETAVSEFDGNAYRLYSGRHLFQLWQAPRAPARVIRVRSDFAKSQVATRSRRG